MILNQKQGDGKLNLIQKPEFFSGALSESDPELFDSIRKELGRQRDEIELIASENITSLAVMQAQGSVMTNKYAEGYSGKRYYGGCEYVDIAEDLAIKRACKLFECSFENGLMRFTTACEGIQMKLTMTKFNALQQSICQN